LSGKSLDCKKRHCDKDHKHVPKVCNAKLKWLLFLPILVHLYDAATLKW